MPADGGAAPGADFRGRVSYRRRFGRPTGLDAADRVELVIDCVGAFGCVALNGQELGEIAAGGSPWRCDITARLQPRNELAIEVELPQLAADGPSLVRPGRDGLPGGLIGEVRLEMYTT
jgi:beta-galactosidase/beta-glucuronidase